MTRELERFVHTDDVLRNQLDRRARVLSVQDANAHHIGYSATKVYDARSRSPPKRYVPEPVPMPMPRSFAGASTGVTVVERSHSPSRRYAHGGSPLRASYKPTYKY